MAPAPPSSPPPPRTFTALVTAFNEERTIGAVIDTLRAAPSVSQVLVVDDASTDATAERAREHGARVHSLSERVDVGRAICSGVELLEPEQLLLLCDADLIGLTVEHIESITAPVLAGEALMSVGVKDSLPLTPVRLLPAVALPLGAHRARALIAWVIRRVLLPRGLLLGGERALSCALFSEAYRLSHSSRGYGLVIVLNHFFLRNGMGTSATFLEGCTHSEKYAKWGWADAARGLARLLVEIPATYGRLLLRPKALVRGVN